MKYLTLFLLFSCELVLGQSASLAKGDTYAIVVGVSHYAESSLNLNFAHKDATIFTEYLLSKSGGSVPQENIKLLIDKDATIARFDLAMQWLLESVKKDNDDLVYIYFSGHGMVDSHLGQGYLLAHDSPSDAFLSNAIQLSQINRVTDALSKRKAKIRIIVDACYAGNSSGIDNMGSLLSGEERVAESDYVIRMTSSEHDQESHESIKIGGGRGAFSYHIINALQGEADYNNDMYVIKGELERYLEESLPKSVNRAVREDQVAKIDGGKYSTKIAKVDSFTKANLNNPNFSLDKIRFRKTQLTAYFDTLSRMDVKSIVDFGVWSNFSSDQLVDSVLYMTEGLIAEMGLVDNWQGDSESFKRELAIILLDDVQKYLNAFIAGDDEELVRRGFFIPTVEDIKEYADMLSTAMRLMTKSYNGYEDIKVNKHYFEGVALRLMAIREKTKQQRDILIDQAIDEQLKAIKIDDKIAYVYNELGLLYGIIGEDEKAQSSFITATALDENWALPLSNLGRYWYDRENYNFGRDYSDKAVKLQPKYINGYVNLGLNSLQLNNYLLAEESFKKACNLYNDSYSGYRNLGMVYLITGRFKDSEVNFRKQDSINFPQTINANDSIVVVSGLSNPYSSSTTNATFVMGEGSSNLYLIDTFAIDNSNLIQLLAYGLSWEQKGNSAKAKNYYNWALSLDGGNPLALYGLSRISYANNDLQDAERYALLTNRNYLSKELFEERLHNFLDDRLSISDSIEVFNNDTWVSYCSNEYFTKFQLNTLRAEIYAEMGYLDKSSNLYKSEIDSLGMRSPAYNKLYDIYTEKGLYAKAESLIRNNCKEEGVGYCDKELYLLYETATEDYYAPPIYHYKAAEQLYDLVDVAEDCGIDSLVYKCINHYMKAIHYSSDAVQEDIYVKLGELYKANKYELESKVNLSEVIDSIPNSVASKVSLVQMLIDIGESWNAYNIQKQLFDESVLDFDNLDLMCSQAMQAGDYETADTLLQLLSQYPVDSISMVKKIAMRNLLSGNLKAALANYERIYLVDTNDVEIIYSLSRLNAQLNNTTEAKEYLMKAEKRGFDYYWVLTNDLFMRSIINSAVYRRLKIKIMPTHVRRR